MAFSASGESGGMYNGMIARPPGSRWWKIRWRVRSASPGIRQEHERGACEKDRAIPGRKGEGLHLLLVQTDTQSAGLSPSLALDEHVPRRIEPVDSQPCFDQIEERVPGSASC